MNAPVYMPNCGPEDLSLAGIEYESTDQSCGGDEMARILVVDEDFYYRMKVAMGLELLGYEVVTVSSRRAARDMLLDGRDVGLVLVAVDSADEAEFAAELIRELAGAERSDLPVVVMAHEMSQAHAGAADVLIKPFSDNELGGVIGGVLKRRAQTACGCPWLGGADAQSLGLRPASVSVL